MTRAEHQVREARAAYQGGHVTYREFQALLRAAALEVLYRDTVVCIKAADGGCVLLDDGRLVAGNDLSDK